MESSPHRRLDYYCRHRGRLDRLLLALAYSGLAMLASTVCEIFGIWQALAELLPR